MKHNADYWIEQLQLMPHPEGGYYRETFAATDLLDTTSLGRYQGQPRRAYTLIYYLLKSGQTSKFHRLRSDEIWVFHKGSPLTIHVLKSDGGYEAKVLGADPVAGHSFQHLIEQGDWFGAQVNEDDSFTLVSCFVAPGFDFADFELADPAELLACYPAQQEIIQKL